MAMSFEEKFNVEIGDDFYLAKIIDIRKEEVELLCKCDRIFVRKKSYLFYIDSTKRRCKFAHCGCHHNTVSKYFNNRIITTAKTGAIKRNILFEIDLFDLDFLYEKQNGLCFYSGEKLILSDKHKGNLSSTSNISLDRINSDLGYIIDNCVLCTKQIQLMKNSFSLDYMISLSNSIVKNQKISQNLLEEIKNVKN